MDPDASFGRGGLNPFLDVNELVERIGLDEDDIEWRKEFIGFGEDDERRLDDLEPMMRANSEQIADDFYENILQFEEAVDVISRSPKGVDALKETQQAYLISLSTGDYDRSYFENRARIGKLHEILDMPLKQYIGQYGVYYDLIMSRLDERVQDQVVEAIEEWADERDEQEGGIGRFATALGFGGGDDEEGIDESFEEAVRGAIDDGMLDVLALLRIINLDMQIATDTYVDSYAQQLEDSIERRKQLAQEVEADVQVPIDELYTASETVAKRAEAISTQTSTQAEAVDEAASEISDVSAATQEVASVTSEVREQSERTEQRAASGVDTADETLDELDEIETAVNDVSTAVASLEDRIDEIDTIVERLDDLAQRTNVLAKNARIEASRTPGSGGTSGPLTVIAEEVSEFATQTQSDLRTIERIAEDVKTDAAETIETTDETVDRVDTGADQIRELVDSLDEIHEAAQSTATGMDDVSAATDQQAHSIETIADSVDGLATSADQVATAAESVAAASEEQTASLREVRRSVERLTAEEDDEPPIYEQIR